MYHYTAELVLQCLLLEVRHLTQKTKLYLARIGVSIVCSETAVGECY